MCSASILVRTKMKKHGFRSSGGTYLVSSPCWRRGGGEGGGGGRGGNSDKGRQRQRQRHKEVSCTTAKVARRGAGVAAVRARKGRGRGALGHWRPNRVTSQAKIVIPRRTGMQKFATRGSSASLHLSWSSKG